MEKNKRVSTWLCMLLALCLLATSLAGCGAEAAPSSQAEAPASVASEAEPADETAEPAAASGEAVKVGVLLPMSGTTSYYGEVQLSGIQLYADYVNENGGIASLGGAQVELVLGDSASAPETGISEFERLIEAGVVGVIGPYNSTVAAATAPIAIAQGVPYVIVNATADNFMGEANKYVYRTNTGSFEGFSLYGGLVKYLNENYSKVEKVAIVYDSGDWGSSMYSVFDGLAEEYGYELAVAEGVSNATDLSTLVNKIKQEDVDFVVCAVFSSDANLLVRQMYEYGCDAMMIGPGGGFGDVSFLENLGEMAENCVYVAPYSPAYCEVSEDAQVWNQRYYDEHGMDMGMEACWGWTGMGTLCDAIERAASTDREAIADALYTTDIPKDSPILWYSLSDGIQFATDGEENLTLADGSLRYNNNYKFGETAGNILVQVQNGEWVTVYPTSETGGEHLMVYQDGPA